MLLSYLLPILTLAAVAHPAPRDQIRKERASAQNGQHLDEDADRGVPWEEHLPREPQRRPRPADSERHHWFPPTPTSDDSVPTRTYASLMRRAPLATFTCVPGMNCFTFTCKLLASHFSANLYFEREPYAHCGRTRPNQRSSRSLERIAMTR